MENNQRTLNNGELEKLIAKLGGIAQVRKVLENKLTVKIKDLVLLDENGCFLPQEGSISKGYEQDYLDMQPLVDCEIQLKRLTRSFPNLEFPSISEFRDQSHKLLIQLRENSAYAGLLKGFYMLVCYPKLKINFDFQSGCDPEAIDYGTVIQDMLFPVVKKTYQKVTGQGFMDSGNIKGVTTVIDDSHRRIFSRMFSGPLVGIQFYPFRGIPFFEAQSIVRQLEDAFALSSPLGLMMALISAPRTLLKSNVIFRTGAAVSTSQSRYTMCVYVDHTGYLHYVKSDINSFDARDCIGLTYIG
ncbi:MAG: hypothetical protein ACOYMB_00410 [Patescibacteria group bacterium]